MYASRFMVTMTILLGTAACGNTWGERATTGGAIGAGSGTAIGSVTGIGILPGAVVGGVVGAGVGAATMPEHRG
jgi:osmotically inducible lipoprotein OsmB